MEKISVGVVDRFTYFEEKKLLLGDGVGQEFFAIVYEKNFSFK